MQKLTIGYEGEEQLEQARALAEKLKLPIDNSAPVRLVVTENRLVLSNPPFSPLYADFSIKTWQKRRNAGKQQGLVRACKPQQGMTIIDATAGWGRDAAILASFGANVLMLERHPIMSALLADALDRRDQRSKDVLQLELLSIDAVDYLSSLTVDQLPDVIYLDPMHPERQKSALVKKDMQVLQQLLGASQDTDALFAIALTKAKQRVVVKWPQSQSAMDTPTYSIPGKTVRFDVYLGRAINS